jgi:hypothetical protein
MPAFRLPLLALGLSFAIPAAAESIVGYDVARALCQDNGSVLQSYTYLPQNPDPASASYSATASCPASSAYTSFTTSGSYGALSISTVANASIPVGNLDVLDLARASAQAKLTMTDSITAAETGLYTFTLVSGLSSSQSISSAYPTLFPYLSLYVGGQNLYDGPDFAGTIATAVHLTGGQATTVTLTLQNNLDTLTSFPYISENLSLSTSAVLTIAPNSLADSFTTASGSAYTGIPEPSTSLLALLPLLFLLRRR